MAKPIQKSPPNGDLLREEEAERDLLNTIYSKGAARILLAGLLLTIFAVPIAQIISDRVDGKNERPLILQLLSIRPRLSRPLPKQDDIRLYEKHLDQNSVLTRKLLPPTQLALSTLGAGNEQVMVGRDGRLYYISDYQYVLDEGFFRDQNNKATILGDISSFASQLRARGISLFFMPVPPDPVFYPESFYGARFSARDAPLQNPDWNNLAAGVTRAGAVFVDVTPSFAALKARGLTPWMRYDTHWTPDGMETAATALAESIRRSGVLAPMRSDPQFRLSRERVTFLGDLSIMLHQPPRNRIAPEMTFQVDQVHEPDGRTLKPRPDADVVIIGDSLSDRFDEPSTGSGASICQYLSYLLHRPVDRVNDPAHTIPPIRYAVEYFKAHPDKLNHTKVVVWEINARALGAVGNNWGDVTLPTRPSKAGG